MHKIKEGGEDLWKSGPLTGTKEYEKPSAPALGFHLYLYVLCNKDTYYTSSYIPANDFSSSTLSSFSQGRSRSLRPKCP
ncbi:MAG: hypothetical protein ENTB_04341 [Enterocloster aldenensis]